MPSASARRLVVLFLISSLSKSFSWLPPTNYCYLNCGEQRHTVCDRSHNCGPKPKCKNIPVTYTFRENVLKLLNTNRNRIASGRYGRKYGNVGATNMNALSYDLELEYLAACAANECEFKVDPCHPTKRFHVSELMYKGGTTSMMTNGIEEWFNTMEFMNTSSLIHYFTYQPLKRCYFCMFNKKYKPKSKRRIIRDGEPFGHDARDYGYFTQLVWANTKYVGCAHSISTNGTTFFVCMFGPAGNIEGESVYHVAHVEHEVGSECQSGLNVNYPALCGDIDPVPEEEALADANTI